jgi:hypothetical protein
MARKNKKAQDLTTQTKAAARRAHFADGGSASKWMGKGARHQDRKKASNKKACRGRVSY